MLTTVLGVLFGLLNLIGHLDTFAGYLSPELVRSIVIGKTFVGGVGCGMFFCLLICGQLKAFLKEQTP
jgi:hypothetical protein